MGKRGGPSLHAFIKREAASTGQLKDPPAARYLTLTVQLESGHREIVWNRYCTFQDAAHDATLEFARGAVGAVVSGPKGATSLRPDEHWPLPPPQGPDQ